MDAANASPPINGLTSPAGAASGCVATEIEAPVETERDTEAGVGFGCNCTVAWGIPDLGPMLLAGTFAVSFLASPINGAGAMVGGLLTGAGFCGAGVDADGGVLTGGAEGGFGPAGGAGGMEGGFGATGGGGGADAPGGLGAAGAALGGAGGFGTESPLGGAGGTGAPGAFCTGLGGRLIIAVSRGFDVSG